MKGGKGGQGRKRVQGKSAPKPDASAGRIRAMPNNRHAPSPVPSATAYPRGPSPRTGFRKKEAPACCSAPRPRWIESARMITGKNAATAAVSGR
jgi:hypothetical protein